MVAHTEVELCVCIRLLGSLAIPLHRFCLVLLHALTIVVAHTEAERETDCRLFVLSTFDTHNVRDVVSFFNTNTCLLSWVFAHESICIQDQIGPLAGYVQNVFARTIQITHQYLKFNVVRTNKASEYGKMIYLQL